jgi:hypothetical protein
MGGTPAEEFGWSYQFHTEGNNLFTKKVTGGDEFFG